ncbi:MAG: SusC/RagA family TonB-linked outer membrane protein [Parabacteroides sp.]|nr:SusC/RagA family TonB-linked outer membrane protein [Parabacteroides sp.]
MEMNYFKKTGKMMVAACMLAGLPFIPGTASASELQTQMMSVQMESTTLEELFDLIEEKFNYTFLIRNNDINLNERISIDMSNRSVEEILTTALKNQHADFVVNNNRIVVYKSSSNPNESRNAERMVAQQTITISGTIVDAVTGEPVIGANVLVKGTTNGTSTDFDGKFSLEAPAGATLVVSYIGYVNHEVKATSASMTIPIKEDTQNLEEVVVVGYGVQKKESLTGAMQVLKSEKLTDITTPSVENMLNGKAPGVYVSPGSGQPGSQGAVVIRGSATISGSTAPLWVIDGVIVGAGAGSLNPSDIESMTILKDAASTAIYGSQGANGVIVVTTKKGKSGKMTINASVKLGASTLNNGNLQMMSGSELYDYYKSFSNSEQISFPRWNEDLRNSNHDWWKLATKTGFTQDYNISLSGGSEQLRSYFSLGMYDEDGAVKGYDFKRYNFRLKTDYKPFEWLTVKPSISGAKQDVTDQQYSVTAMYTMFPWDNPYDEDGNPMPHRSKEWVNSNSTNYLYDLQWNKTTSTRYEFTGNIDFDVRFTDWLTFSSVNSFRWRGYNYKSYTDPRSDSGSGVNGRLEEYQDHDTRLYTNQILRFNKTWGKHAVNGLAAYEFNDRQTRTLKAIGTGFVPGMEILDDTALPESVKGKQEEWAIQSLLFNANYAYDNKYLLQLSFRRDGASNFGDNAKWGNFFSVSAGWNINRENWFQADWVDVLKLRASYGSVGNLPSKLYPQYNLYAATDGSGKSYSYDGISGLLISQVGNDELTWEKTFTTGVGVDAGFFENRLRLTFDYYSKFTSNILYAVPVSGLTGVTRLWQNVGEMKNNGIELSLGADIIRTKDWNWGIDVNLGHNSNKLEKLYDNLPASGLIISDGSTIAGTVNKILKPGYSIDTYYVREWAGVNPETGAPQWYTTDDNGARVITEKYAEADQVIYKKSTPDLFGGFSTNLSWKQLDLSANFGYSIGGKIYNYSRQEYDSDGTYTDRNQMKLMDDWSRWEKPGDIATHPVASYNNSSLANKASSRYIEDASYLRLRSLTVGYNLSLPQYYIQNMRVYFSAENLFTITGYSGVDPELPAGERDGMISVMSTTGASVYPSTRKFMFGVNLTF